MISFNQFAEPAQSRVNPILADALELPSDIPVKTAPRHPHQRLRGRKQCNPTLLLARAQELVREAYDNLASAGSLLLTAEATARGNDRETIELSRAVLRDCASDISQVAYVLPRDYSPAIDAIECQQPDPRVKARQSAFPVVANGRGGVSNY